MSARIVNMLPKLKRVKRLTRAKQRKFIQTCDRDFMNCVCNCARQIIKGCAKIKSDHFKKLSRHKKSLRKLILKKTSLKSKRKYFNRAVFSVSFCHLSSA